MDEASVPIPGASVLVVNMATGATSRANVARDGRYLVQGLEVGGPYSVTARHPGFIAQMRDGQMLTVSQNLTLDFRLQRQTVILSTVTVTTEPTGRFRASAMATRGLGWGVGVGPGEPVGDWV